MGILESFWTFFRGKRFYVTQAEGVGGAGDAAADGALEPAAGDDFEGQGQRRSGQPRLAAAVEALDGHVDEAAAQRQRRVETLPT